MTKLSVDEIRGICAEMNDRFSIIMAAGGITLQEVVEAKQGEPVGMWYDDLTCCYVPISLSGLQYAEV